MKLLTSLLQYVTTAEDLLQIKHLESKETVDVNLLTIHVKTLKIFKTRKFKNCGKII